MPEAVYLLCVITIALCAVAVLRTHRQRRTRLLLWSCLWFIGLAVNNLLVFVDVVVTGPEVDLSIARASVGSAASGGTPPIECSCGSRSRSRCSRSTTPPSASCNRPRKRATGSSWFA